MRFAICFVSFACFSASVLAAEDAYAFVDVAQLPDVEPNQSAFEDGKETFPIQIKSAEGLVKYFGNDQGKTIGKKIDWQRQQILVFAWRGSSKDHLYYTILKSNPPQYVFYRARGETRDLKQHAYVYVVGLSTKWSVVAND